VISFGDICNFNFLATNLILVGIYLILTLSLNLINGQAGMFSLGHQGFWALGAYAAGAVVVHFVGSTHDAVLFILSLLVAGSVAGLAGLCVGVPCLRLRGDYLVIATLGFAEIVRIILANLEWVGGSRGLRIPALLVEKSPDTATLYFLFYLGVTYAVLAFTIMVCRNLMRSGHGRAILSLREDEVAAGHVGVPVTYYKILTFVVGAVLAGLAGGIYANFFGVLSPKDFGLMVGILLLLMVVLGGTGSMSGTVIATILLYVAQQLFKLRLLGIPSALASITGAAELRRAASDFEQLAVERWQLLFAVLLIVLMIAAPQGLMGRKEFHEVKWLRWVAGRLQQAVMKFRGKKC